MTKTPEPLSGLAITMSSRFLSLLIDFSSVLGGLGSTPIKDKHNQRPTNLHEPFTTLKLFMRPKGFLGIGISIASKNVFKPKKVNSDAFAIKSSFKFPTLVTPNEVDRVIKDW